MNLYKVIECNMEGVIRLNAFYDFGEALRCFYDAMSSDNRSTIELLYFYTTVNVMVVCLMRAEIVENESDYFKKYIIRIGTESRTINNEREKHNEKAKDKRRKQRNS